MADTKQQLADYYACVTGLDHHVGHIFAELKASGQWENTIIIFSAGNGLSLGEHGLFGKQNLSEFGGMHVLLVIPIYQRTYSWTEKECQQLWDDIVHASTDDRISVHFVGSIVYIEQGLSQVTHQSPLLVIDEPAAFDNCHAPHRSLRTICSDERRFPRSL